MGEVLKSALGAQVRAARRRAGLTQEALATKVAKTPESISNIERGQQLPMLDTLAAIAAALDVPIRDFFGAADDDRVSPRRRQLEAEMQALVRRLDDERLATAVRQVEVLAGEKARR